MFKSFEEIIEDLKHPDARVRQEACYLLGKEETQETAELLAEALSDADPQVQFLAMKALSRLKFLGIRPSKPLPVKQPPAQASPAKGSSPQPPVRFTLNPLPSGFPPPDPAVGPPRPPVVPAPTPKTASPQTLPPRPPPFSTAPSPAPKPAPVPPVPPPSPVPVAPLAPVPVPPASPSVVSQTSPASVIPPREPGPPTHLKPVAPAPGSPASPDSPVSSVALPPEPTPSPASAPDTPSWQETLGCPPQGFITWFTAKEARERVSILSRLEGLPPQKSLREALASLLQTETDVFVLSKATKVFGKQMGAGCLQHLERFLEHSDTRVIANSLEALGVSGGTAELQRIAQFLDHPDSRIRATAAQHLWEAHPDKAFAVIERMSRSQMVWEKEAARHALKSCPLPAGKELQVKIGQPSLTKNAEPSPATDSSTPLWKSLLLKPVEVGIDRPLQVWEFLLLVLALAAFGYFIALPTVDWLFPVNS